MKISKKLFAVASVAAVLATGAFMSCSSSSEGSSVASNETGNKKDKSVTVDFTDETKSDELYARLFNQLGTSEGVAEITTKITVSDMKKKEATSPLKVGYFFNENTWKDSEGKEYYDMCLFGIDPLDPAKWYLERYYSVVSAQNKLEAEEATLGYTSSIDMGAYDAIVPETGIYASTPLTAGTNYVKDETAGTFVCYVTVKQSTPGTYDIYISADGSVSDATKVASYEAVGKKLGKQTGESAKDQPTKSINGKTYAIGGVGYYATVSKGSKETLRYETDTKSVTGSFNAKTTEE